MRVRFNQDHRFTPPGTARTVRYKIGATYTVKREWGDAMVALGACDEIKVPRQRPARGPRAKKTTDA